MSTTLRSYFQTLRSNLSPEVEKTASCAVVSRLLSLPVFLQSQHIALYSPIKGEIDLTALLTLFPKKNFYFPRMGKPLGQMDFFPTHHLSELVPNRLGIAEPDPKKTPPVDPYQLELVLLPLVAFDENGHRLGAGGGYYDRYFEFTKQPLKQHRSTLIGVAYDFQKSERLPHLAWDVPLDGVVTESSVLFFSR